MKIYINVIFSLWCIFSLSRNQRMRMCILLFLLRLEKVSAEESHKYVVSFLKQFSAGGDVVNIRDTNYVLLSSNRIANVKIKTIHNQLEEKSITLMPYNVHSLQYNKDFRMKGNIIESKGIELVSNVSINVQAINIGDFSSDGTWIRPVVTLGTTYIAVGFESFLYNSVVGMTSLYEDTTIQIFSPSIKDNNTNWIEEKEIRLDELQSYMYEKDGGDITGWKLVGTKKFAAFSGHVCSEVPAATTSSMPLEMYMTLCSHLYEQLPPVEQWGEGYLTLAGHIPTSKSLLRILLSDPNTQVVVDGEDIEASGGKNYLETFIIPTSVQSIECSKPCMAVQFSGGKIYAVDDLGDADMTVLPPLNTYTGTCMVQSVKDAQNPPQPFPETEVLIISRYQDSLNFIDSINTNFSIGWQCAGMKYAWKFILIENSTYIIKNLQENANFLLFSTSKSFRNSYSHVACLSYDSLRIEMEENISTCAFQSSFSTISPRIGNDEWLNNSINIIAPELDGQKDKHTSQKAEVIILAVSVSTLGIVILSSIIYLVNRRKRKIIKKKNRERIMTDQFHEMHYIPETGVQSEENWVHRDNYPMTINVPKGKLAEPYPTERWNYL